MSYLEILNMFKQFAAQHKQVKCFGYGNLSDIEVPVDPTTGQPIQRDYAYLFLNPTNHSMTAHTITYRFNVIVMDLASELQPTGFSGLNSTIKAQSDTLLIINDLLAWIEYNNVFDTELVQTTSITPFKERFNDTVAGMTATLEFVVPNQLNLCDAPVGEDIVPELYLWRTNSVDSYMGEDPFELVNMYFDTAVLSGSGEFLTNYSFRFAQDTNIRVEYEYSFLFQQTGNFPYPPTIYGPSGPGIEPVELIGWPTIPLGNTTYTIKAVYEFEAQAAVGYAYRLEYDTQTSRRMFVSAGNSVKIYKL